MSEHLSERIRRGRSAPFGPTPKACEKEMWRRRKALGNPAFHAPAERLAERCIAGICRRCARCAG